MTHKIVLAAFITALVPGLLFSGPARAQFWEIPDPDLKYIAMIRADPNWGSAVIYNPVHCEEVGKACGFFRKHAFAHAHMNHLLLPPKAYPVATELRADCWAAKNGKPDEVLAAYELMKNYDGNRNWILHGDTVQRAQKVRECALQAGNWIGGDS